MVFNRRVNRVLKVALTICVIFGLYKIFYRTDESAPDLDMWMEDHKTDFNGYNVSLDGSHNQKKVLDVDNVFKFASPIESNTILSSLKFLNAHHNVLNQDIFGELNSDNLDNVIVVQVHNRLTYLKYLVETLKNNKGIEKALLIFSHDISNNEINDLIRSIKFCRVIQIFFPNNIQLFPNVFPGQDPDDCPEKISKAEAQKIHCNNFNDTDKYGHYRMGRLTQIKHHWWWKMNYVFDGIIQKYKLEDKYVLLLEEDHYVSPDALHVLQLMISSKDDFCPECEILGLGVYLKRYNTYKNDINKLGVFKWFSSKHNMGMALNITTWNNIRNCSEMFCTYDDYNWDWSMLKVNLNCLPIKMKILLTKAPRVIHVGDCGVHTHRCNVHAAVDNAKNLFSQHEDILYPKELVKTETSQRTLKPSKPNGGWGDRRDHKLCLDNTFPYNIQDLGLSL